MTSTRIRARSYRERAPLPALPPAGLLTEAERVWRHDTLQQVQAALERIPTIHPGRGYSYDSGRRDPIDVKRDAIQAVLDLINQNRNGQ